MLTKSRVRERNVVNPESKSLNVLSRRSPSERMRNPATTALRKRTTLQMAKAALPCTFVRVSDPNRQLTSHACIDDMEGRCPSSRDLATTCWRGCDLDRVPSRWSSPPCWQALIVSSPRSCHGGGTILFTPQLSGAETLARARALDDLDWSKSMGFTDCNDDNIFLTQQR
jgi:hypothetical protein